MVVGHFKYNHGFSAYIQGAFPPLRNQSPPKARRTSKFIQRNTKVKTADCAFVVFEEHFHRGEESKGLLSFVTPKGETVSRTRTFCTVTLSTSLGIIERGRYYLLPQNKISKLRSEALTLGQNNDKQRQHYHLAGSRPNRQWPVCVYARKQFVITATAAHRPEHAAAVLSHGARRS